MPASRRIKFFGLITLLLLISLAVFTSYGFKPHTTKLVGRLEPGIHASACTLSPPEDGNHFCFAVYGDTRKGIITHGKILRQLITLKQANPTFKFVINTGDIVNDGSNAKDWLDLMQTPGFMELGAQIPTFPAVGNHENIDQKLPVLWLQFFAPVLKANASSLRYEADKPWYALHYGNCLFLFLDSNIMADADFLDHTQAKEQYLWAAEQLSQPGFTYKFAIFHHSPFSSDGHHLENSLRVGTYRIPGTEKYFLDLFAQNRVQAIFLGHIHTYERWLEERTNQNERPYYLNWIITGGGGARLNMYPSRVLGDSKSVTEKLDRDWDIKEMFSPGIHGPSYLERNPKARLMQAFPRQKSQLHNYFHYCIVDVSPQKILLNVYALDEQKGSFFLLDQTQLYPHQEITSYSK